MPRSGRYGAIGDNIENNKSMSEHSHEVPLQSVSDQIEESIGSRDARRHVVCCATGMTLTSDDELSQALYYYSFIDK